MSIILSMMDHPHSREESSPNPNTLSLNREQYSEVLAILLRLSRFTILQNIYKGTVEYYGFLLLLLLLLLFQSKNKLILRTCKFSWRFMLYI